MIRSYGDRKRKRNRSVAMHKGRTWSGDERNHCHASRQTCRIALHSSNTLLEKRLLGIMSQFETGLVLSAAFEIRSIR